MHRKGHVGASLLAYSPVAALVTAAGFREFAVGGAVAAAALAMVPDLDLRVPFVEHRGVTHTVWFVAAMGVLAAVLGLAAGLSRGVLAGLGVGVFAGVVVAVTLAAHVAADALTPMGVEPWAPRSNETYSLDVVRAANPVANYLLLGVGVFAVAVAYTAGTALAGPA